MGDSVTHMASWAERIEAAEAKAEEARQRADESKSEAALIHADLAKAKADIDELKRPDILPNMKRL